MQNLKEIFIPIPKFQEFNRRTSVHCMDGTYDFPTMGTRSGWKFAGSVAELGKLDDGTLVLSNRHQKVHVPNQFQLGAVHDEDKGRALKKIEKMRRELRKCLCFEGAPNRQGGTQQPRRVFVVSLDPWVEENEYEF